MRRPDPKERLRRLPEGPAQKRFELGGAGRYVVPCVAVGLLAAGVVTGAASGTPSWLVVTLCVTAALLAAGGNLIWSAYEAPPGSLAAAPARRRTDRESGGLQRVERLLENGLTDLDRFNLRLRPWLLQLAGQRLLRHAHVRLDDEAARPLLGDSLWELTQGPRTTVPSRQQLRDWVTRIEAL
jgi:hypothetical protein